MGGPLDGKERRIKCSPEVEALIYPLLVVDAELLQELQDRKAMTEEREYVVYRLLKSETSWNYSLTDMRSLREIEQFDAEEKKRGDRLAWNLTLTMPILVVLFAMMSPIWPGPWWRLQIFLIVLGSFVTLGVIAGMGITIALRRWILHPYRSIIVAVVCSAILLAALWQMAVHLDILPGNERRFYSDPRFGLAIAVGLGASLVIAFRWRVSAH
jgi:hypothetical protein